MRFASHPNLAPKMYKMNNEVKSEIKTKIFCPFRKARDVYDTMLPVFILSKILGLAPFNFRLSQPRGLSPHCGPITIVRIVTVIGIIGYVAVLVHDIQTSFTITSLAQLCELYCGALVSGSVLTLAVTNQNLLIRAVENIVRIDHDMKAIGINVSYKNAQRFAYFQICGITCVFCSKLTIQAFSVKKYYIFIYNVFNVVDYINTIMLFQYVDILLLLRQRYIWINREIKALVLQKRLRLTHIVNRTTVHLHKDLLENIPLLSPDYFITELGKIHGMLFLTAKLINRTYGVQLLVTIAARFIMITTQLINTYKTIEDPHRGDPITYTLTAIYLFLHGSKLFMIASISENTASKARDTGVYLHQLWEVNAAARDKINFFSLQVLHQKLKFTAADFFFLDYKLIHSIVAAVTTYLIIIIQFDVNARF